MRIGFFGGSFDPPHRGHLAVARTVAATFRLSRLLLAPTAQQPLKPGGAAASFDDRLAMVEILCRTEPRLEPSALDAPRTHDEPNYTIDTLSHLRATFPGSTEIYSIVGADSFLDLRRWRSPNDLLDIVDWIVVSRPGFSFSDLDRLHLTPEQRSRVYLLQGVTDPVSATEVRDCLREGRDCSDLVLPDVLRYIREHHLYGA